MATKKKKKKLVNVGTIVPNHKATVINNQDALDTITSKTNSAFLEYTDTIETVEDGVVVFRDEQGQIVNTAEGIQVLNDILQNVAFHAKLSEITNCPEESSGKQTIWVTPDDKTLWSENAKKSLNVVQDGTDYKVTEYKDPDQRKDITDEIVRMSLHYGDETEPKRYSFNKMGDYINDGSNDPKGGQLIHIREQLVIRNIVVHPSDCHSNQILGAKYPIWNYYVEFKLPVRTLEELKTQDGLVQSELNILDQYAPQVLFSGNFLYNYSTSAECSLTKQENDSGQEEAIIKFWCSTPITEDVIIPQVILTRVVNKNVQ